MDKAERKKRCIFTPSKLRDTVDHMEICKRYLSDGRDQDGFRVEAVDRTIGKGLFASRKFYRAEFLIEYKGELMTHEEAIRRKKRCQQSLRAYMYFFKYSGKELCVDATSSKSIGRYINEGIGEENNAKLIAVDVSGRPHLAVFATQNIQPGEEIRCSYGISNLPWRQDLNKTIPLKRGQMQTANNHPRGTRVLKTDIKKMEGNTNKPSVRNINKTNMPVKSQAACSTIGQKQTIGLKGTNPSMERKNAKPFYFEKAVTETSQKAYALSVKEGKAGDTTVRNPLMEKLPLKRNTTVSAVQNDKKHITEMNMTKDSFGSNDAIGSSIDKMKKAQANGSSTRDRKANKTTARTIYKKNMPVKIKAASSQEQTIEINDTNHSLESTDTRSSDLEKGMTETSHQTYVSSVREGKVCETTARNPIKGKMPLKRNTTISTVQNDKEHITEMDKTKDSFRNNDAIGSSFENMTKTQVNGTLTSDGKVNKTTARTIYMKNMSVKSNAASSQQAVIGLKYTNHSLESTDTRCSYLEKEVTETSQKADGSSVREEKANEIAVRNPLKGKIPLKQNTTFCTVEDCEKDRTEIRKTNDSLGNKDIIGFSFKELTKTQSNRCLESTDTRGSYLEKEVTETSQKADVSSVREEKANEIAVRNPLKGKIPLKQNTTFCTVEDCEKDRTEIKKTNDSLGNKDIIGFSFKELTKKQSNRCLESKDTRGSYLEKEVTETSQKADGSSVREGKANYTTIRNPLKGKNPLKQITAFSTVEDGEENLIEIQKTNESLGNNDTIGSSVRKMTETHTNTKGTLVTDLEKSKQENITGKIRKPYRPCPYCQKMMSKLRSHLERKHAKEDDVKAALLLPKQERDVAFDALRKKGIFKVNMHILKDKTISRKKCLLRERAQVKNDEDIIYCSYCFAFISKRLFYRHKTLCQMKGDSSRVPSRLRPQHTLSDADESKFQQTILESFHEDTVGNICRTDDLIVDFGRKEYMKVSMQSDKKDEKRKALQSEMRRLGRLYVAFRDICRTKKINCDSAIAMFERSNFSHLESSINKVSSQHTANPRASIKLGLGYLLRKVSKYVYGRCLEEKNDAKAEEIDRFKALLEYQWLKIFGEAEYSVTKVRQSNLRKPQNLPLNEDVQLLRDFTVRNITEIVHDKGKLLSSTNFTFLRDLLVCRLTLFNARRGGEPSRLTLKEWDDANKNVWADTTNSTIKDPVEKMLLGRYKLAYQPGKTGKLVPLLVIDDCWQALHILTDVEVRTRIGIEKDNIFVFPQLQMSLRHVVGWNAVNKCCQLAGCSKMINATIRRHQVATMYAAHEVPSDERAGFLLHMDHSEGINMNVYQSPPAVREITKVGRVLYQLDKSGRIDRNVHSSSLVELDDTHTDSSKSTQYLSEDTVRQNEDERQHNGRKRKLELQFTDTEGKRLRPKRECSRINKNIRGSNDPAEVWEHLPLSDDFDASEDEYRPTKSSTSSSDESDELSEPTFINECVPKQKKIRPYWKWDEQDTNCIKRYFAKYIFSTENFDTNKGHLPGVKDIQTFLMKYPNILAGQTFRVKLNRIKTKIFNERKTVRSRMIPSGK